MIVGRDPESLDEGGVARAAIESCAENFSDGVVAPVFWLALCGLPGLIVYKAINTADSMIGHRTPRYRDFGWAAARLDDISHNLHGDTVVPYRVRDDGSFANVAATLLEAHRALCEAAILLAATGAPSAALPRSPDSNRARRSLRCCAAW